MVGHALLEGGHQRPEEGLHRGERREDHAVRGAPHPHQDHDGEGGRGRLDDAPHPQGAEEAPAPEEAGAHAGDPRQDQDGHLAAAAAEGQDVQLDARARRRGDRRPHDGGAQGQAAGGAAAARARAAERGPEAARRGAEGQEEAEVAGRGRADSPGASVQDQGLGKQEALVQDRHERAAVPSHGLLHLLHGCGEHRHCGGRPTCRQALQEAYGQAHQVDRGPEG
mmetsp:Transcript_79855/g.234902  ORF Transcript_79855/g.234902 Transcript_79855/m.234902 type:complete len:224 (-) Transcript_79855:308-979(-)